MDRCQPLIHPVAAHPERCSPHTLVEERFAVLIHVHPLAIPRPMALVVYQLVDMLGLAPLLVVPREHPAPRADEHYEHCEENNLVDVDL